MRGKIAFVAGITIGYVLGTRAGRERYEQIKTAATAVWQSPPVQAASGAVGGVVGRQLTKAQYMLADGIKKLVDATIGRPAPARPSAAKPVPPAAAEAAAAEGDGAP